MNSPTPSTSSAHARLTLAVACLVFFSLGLMTAALGPILPGLAEQAGSTLAAIGSVFTAIFLGALLAQLVSGPLGDRVGMPVVLLGGVVLLSVGTLGITLSPALWLVLAMGFLAGLGHGAVDLGANVQIASVFAGRSVSAVNLLNVFFGLGAFAGPLIVGFSLRLWDTGFPALWVSVGLLLALLPFMLAQLRRNGRSAPAQPAASPARQAAGLYASPLLWLLGLLILLYVGTENGIGGWIATYMERTTTWRLDQATTVAAWFWLALTGGRVVTAALGLRLSSRQLLSLSALGGLAGSLLVVLGMGSPNLTILGVLLTGFSFGSVYPTVVALTAAAFEHSPGKAVSVVAAMGSVGGMALPWLQGILLEGVGPSASVWFTALACLLMLGLVVKIRSSGDEKANVGSHNLPNSGKIHDNVPRKGIPAFTAGLLAMIKSILGLAIPPR